MRIRAALRTPLKIEFADAPVSESLRPEAAGAASPDALSARFARELELVGGVAIVSAEKGIDALARAVADHVARLGFHAIAVQGDDFAMQAASHIASDRLIETSGASAESLEIADCAIVAAESLIADTGSVVVRVSSYEQRLLPYLPPSCIVVGRLSHMTAGLDDAALRAGDEERGERVIITGPSRTADIEKTVVLGAHGPGSLTVFIARD